MPTDNAYSPSPKHRVKWMVVMVVMAALVLAGGLGFYWWNKGHAAADQPADSAAVDGAVQVRSAALEKRNLASTVQAFGILTPDVGGSETISLTMPVQIKRLLVAAGQFVKAGQPLFEVVIDPAAEAAYQQAVTAATLARGELSRNEELLSQQLATQSQVAIARKALQDAETMLAAQRSMQAELKGNRVLATHAGLVSSIGVQQGDRLNAGAAILQLTEAGKLTVQLGLTPEDASHVRPGMAVHVAAQFDEQAAGDGVVTQVFGVIDPRTRMVTVVAQLKVMPAGALPGTQVQASIELAASEQWAVARSAVLADDHGSYVYQLRGGHARRVNVKTGTESGGWIGIEGPLDARENVVVSGNYELKDGAAVSEQEQAADAAEPRAEAATTNKPAGTP